MPYPELFPVKSRNISLKWKHSIGITKVERKLKILSISCERFLLILSNSYVIFYYVTCVYCIYGNVVGHKLVTLPTVFIRFNNKKHVFTLHWRQLVSLVSPTTVSQVKLNIDLIVPTTSFVHHSSVFNYDSHDIWYVYVEIMEKCQLKRYFGKFRADRKQIRVNG